jgi:hypothetical protein
LKKLIPHTTISFLFLAFCVLAFASKGGGGDKKKAASAFRDNFTPISASGGFTLKSGYTFNGSYVLSQEKTAGTLSIHSMVTFQKGNTTYIIPYQSRISLESSANSASRSSLQFLGVRIKMSK